MNQIDSIQDVKEGAFHSKNFADCRLCFHCNGPILRVARSASNLKISKVENGKSEKAIG